MISRATLPWSLISLLVSCGGSNGEPKVARHDASDAGTAGAERANAAPALPELDPLTVARSLRGNEAELRACFDAGSTRVSGFMRLGFRVEASGDVTNVEIETSSFAEPAVAACLSERVARLHFEPLEAPKAARWTFVAGLAPEPDPDGPRNGKRKRTTGGRQKTGGEQGVTIDRASRGSLEPEEIEEVVYAGFGLFAHCYREGLGRHPGLRGVVRLRMVIGRDGVVDELRDSGSDIADREVVDCVAEGFFALRFPKPRAKTVRLRYRIVFDTG